MKINTIEFTSAPGRGSSFGKAGPVVILTMVLLFIALQSVLIYGYFLSVSVSHGAPVPKIILDKTEEVYISRLAELVEFSGKNLSGGDMKKVASGNRETIENELIAALDSAPGDSLETVLISGRVLFNRPYSFKHIRAALFALEEYARARIVDKDSAGAARAVNSMLTLAMVPQLGIDSEKALICDLITNAFMTRTMKLIDEFLKSGVKIDSASLDKLLVKIAVYESVRDDFAGALRHEKKACRRMIESHLYSMRPDVNKYNQIATIMFVKTSELYYGSIAEQYSAIMDRAIAASGLKFGEADRKLEELSHLDREINKAMIYPLALLRSEIHPLVIYSVPSLDKFHREFLGQRARTRATMIKLAARRVEDATGRAALPAAIEGFKADPVIRANQWAIEDPFTSKPLLYKKGDTGEITIYSAGYDMKDDGGSFADGRDIKL